jgi:hypothetical protein
MFISSRPMADIQQSDTLLIIFQYVLKIINIFKINLASGTSSTSVPATYVLLLHN